MRVVVVGFLMAGIGAAAPDALKTYRQHLAVLLKREEKLRWNFADRVSDALEGFEAPMRVARAKPHAYPNATHDYTGLRRLYRELEQNAKAMALEDLLLAKSGHARALPVLFFTLLRTANVVAKLEEELEAARPRWRNYFFDQAPGIVRHMIDVRFRGLVEAISKCPNAARFCAADGLKQARKKDGRRSVVRQIAVIDVLARTGSPMASEALFTALLSKLSCMRVAAVEGLMRLNAKAQPSLVLALRDPSPVVRRALLQEIVASAKDPGWIGPLVRFFAGARGVERTLALHALEGLTRQRFGYSPDAWKEWHDEHRKLIAAGDFDAAKIEVNKTPPEPATDGTSFYGIPTLSRGIVFVVTGSQHIVVPADWNVQRTQEKDRWSTTRANWEKKYPSHRTILAKEFKKTLARLSKNAVLGFIALQGSFSAEVLGGKKLLKQSARTTKQVMRHVRRLSGSGWCSQYEGFRAAARLGGLPPGKVPDFPDPRIDTVFLLDSGDPAGGRFMTPESAVAAFKRFNRFRRLIVHTIRIANEKEPSETLMKGIAEATGGTYRWIKRPR